LSISGRKLNVDEVRRVVQHLPVGAELNARAPDRFVLE
jgi:hypothetical protein